MKTIVINKIENTRVPFLRGILIRNLILAGMPFEESFELANQVRAQLADCEEISTTRLRRLVDRLLLAHADPAVLEQYQSPSTAPAKITVVTLGLSVSAFSRDRHQRYLQASGVAVHDAEIITNRLYDQLLISGTSSITTCQLGYLTYLCLQQDLSETLARQYLVWSEFQRSGRPLLLLICGAVGSGKSSIATEIGHRLEIVRTQSTDMLREVMRSMIPKKLLPVLHCSSFDAWKTLPVHDSKKRDKDALLAEGYRTQADLLALACEAVMQRAVRESTPLILEGVHAHPNLLDKLPRGTDAIAVHVTLAVMNAKELEARLSGRSSEEPQRRAKRYLNKFDSIWRLQSFVLAEADRYDSPVIPNDDREATIFQLVSIVNQQLSRYFSGSPQSVFGPTVSRVKKQINEKSWQESVSPILKSEKPARSRNAS